MKIVVLDGYTENPGDLSWDALKALGNEFVLYDRTPAEKIIERAKGFEVIYTNKTPLTAQTLKQLPECKFIGVLATGYNVVDVNAAKENGIVVSNIPTYGTDSVAQMVFAHLLAMSRHVVYHSNEVKKGRWSECPDFCFWDYPLTELSGLTMGIIGFGRIGQAAAKIANAMNMKVLAYDSANFEVEGIDYEWVDMDTLLKNSDVISLHCPLFKETEGLINKENIAKMKDGAFLINTSRGPLIVDQDVADALNSGKLGGAGLDVLTVEPPAMDNPLMTAKNCNITPHISWATKSARARLMDIAVSNLKAFKDGNPINVVNK
jgi:glycerate dehydrogenase